MMDIHVKLRYKGKPTDIKTWHNFMHWVDADWPYINPTQDCTDKTRLCMNCGGRVYKTARFAPEDVKRAARLFGVKVKIDRYAVVGKCFPGGMPEKYMHLLASEVKGAAA